MANKINEHHHDNCENVCSRERRNEKRERGEERRFQKNNRDAGEDVDLQAACAHRVQRVAQLFALGAAHLAHRFAEHSLFAQIKNNHEQRAHQSDADGQQKQHAEKFAEQIFETRHWFRQNGVNRAVFDVLRNQTRRRDDGEQRTEDRHRTERNVFQNLELLLKTEPRHEDGTADENERENQQNIENLLTRQFGERVGSDRENTRRRESAVLNFRHFPGG